MLGFSYEVQISTCICTGGTRTVEAHLSVANGEEWSTKGFEGSLQICTSSLAVDDVAQLF